MSDEAVESGTGESGTGPGEPFRILFVCTGNTCRSPMAQAIARRLTEERGWGHVVVSSAGVGAGSGAPASRGARMVAESAGLDLSSHESRVVTAELVAEADLILAMTPSHRRMVEESGGEGKVVLLGAFAAGAGDDEEGEVRWAVPDPFGGDEESYRETFRALEEMVERAFDRLRPVVAP